LLVSSTLASAQAPEAKRNALDALKKQIPTDKEAAAEAAEFQKKNVPAPPLPAGSPELDVLRDRAANLRQQHESFLKNVAAGTTKAYPDLIEARPQHEKDVAALTKDLATLAAEKDPSKRELATKALFAALQPLGPFLLDADYAKGAENVLSPEQQNEFKRLEAAWDAAATNHPPKTPPLTVVGPSQLYTLTYLSVPLLVRGAPNSTILFRAEAGGLFPNRLPIIEVKTDENGLATTSWSTLGDAIANCPINLRSSAAPTDGTSINITTVKLALAPLPDQPGL
jgi:hypothetical protein